tara:strand:- start:719 stop:925 length:207 start_codon:yes stop_codon:yes gene_type:complete
MASEIGAGEAFANGSVEEGLRWLQMYGIKNFKDSSGEWVEVRCPHQLNLWGEEVGIEDVIPHLIHAEA